MKKRKSYLAVKQRNAAVLEQIKAIKQDHPFWGYRRVWAYLRYHHKLTINLKRVYRLMKENNLLVAKNQKLKAKRTSNRSKPKPLRPNQWWGIDMTKVKVGGFGYIYVVFVIDWHTKKILGYYAHHQSKSKDWLMALDMAVNQQFPDGIRGNALHLMSDNGCQPTSTAFMQYCGTLGIKQAFTAYNNPKGNADTERLMRTFKEEIVWPYEWDDALIFKQKIDQWVRFYNEEYPHSALGYIPPCQFEQKLKEYQISINNIFNKKDYTLFNFTNG